MARVGVIMGSDSDLPVMCAACRRLEALGIDYEVTVLSAHRTPERLAEYAKAAEESGVRVIIAGAGGAAHLPGMMAAFTVLPVIGVPVKTAALSGVDSLYSVVQMPSGVPVATVAIGGADNAAILAAEILGAFEPEAREAVRRMKEKMNEEVRDKARSLETLGPEEYLKRNFPGAAPRPR